MKKVIILAERTQSALNPRLLVAGLVLDMEKVSFKKRALTYINLDKFDIV